VAGLAGVGKNARVTPATRACGVLQIEPTDFCNLTCPMCHPQQGFRPTLHGDLLKGYMDMGLYRRIIFGIAAGGVHFDHVIFQWLGDPSLHPELFTMLDLALERIGDRAQYFRIDTNAILLGEDRARELLDIVDRHPSRTVLLVFSLDAASRETYRKVKGRDAFSTVMENVERLVTLRAARARRPSNLNFEFQFVLQAGNHHEARAFIDHWDRLCARPGGDAGWNEVMIKRLSVGTGGELQHEADRLYADTVARQGLEPIDHPHLHVKLWMERAWHEHDDPAAGRSDLQLGETGVAAPRVGP
jgi:hypothetical protein